MSETATGIIKNLWVGAARSKKEKRDWLTKRSPSLILDHRGWKEVTNEPITRRSEASTKRASPLRETLKRTFLLQYTVAVDHNNCLYLQFSHSLCAWNRRRRSAETEREFWLRIRRRRERAESNGHLNGPGTPLYVYMYNINTAYWRERKRRIRLVPLTVLLDERVCERKRSRQAEVLFRDANQLNNDDRLPRLAAREERLLFSDVGQNR